MTRNDFEELLRRYTLGNCTKRERILICNWFKKMKFGNKTFLNKEEHAFTEHKILNFIEEKIKRNNTDPESEISFDGFLNACLIYAGTMESLMLIETLNSNLLFT